MNTDAVVERILERIADLDITRVIVFGSSTDGTVGTDSDLDIAVVFANPDGSKRFDRMQRKLEIRRRIPDINSEVAIDLVAYTQSEFESLAQQPSFVRSQIVERGQTVYEKAG